MVHGPCDLVDDPEKSFSTSRSSQEVPLYIRTLSTCTADILTYPDMEGDHINSPSTCSPSEDGDHRRSIDIAESKPHPNLWFDDGSLVIQASSVRYRVHRTIVCKHSSIFRDMVAMPQPGGTSDDENTFDGCPLVRLSDSPDDLSVLLEAIYSNPEYVQQLCMTDWCSF